MVPLSLISLPFFLLPWLSLAEDPIHIGLQRRNPHPFDHTKEADRLRDRYGYPPSNASLLGRGKRATGSIPIINQGQDTSYVATINLGIPPQQLSVVLDTGSTDLWVATTACTSCSPGTKLFNSATSSSFKSSASRVTISYGSGEVAGIVIQDTVSMGIFTMPNQTLLGVTEIGNKLIEGAVSGIMGLAWPPLANTRADPFWYRLADADALTAPDMSFWLKRQIDNPSSVELTDGGVFTLGGINTTLYTGDIEFLPIPVQPPSFWLLALSSLTLNGTPISVKTGSSALSAIDTGTTLIGGPTDDVARFWAAVPGASVSTTDQGFYTFPCDTKISAAMAFGGKSWSISSVDMNVGRIGRNLCVGAIFDLALGSSIPPGGTSPSWVVGATFLKNVYTVFRASSPPSIGFAQLSSAAGGSSGAGVVDSSTVVFTKTRSGPDSTNTASTGNPTSSSSILSASILCVMISLVPSLLHVL